MSIVTTSMTDHATGETTPSDTESPRPGSASLILSASVLDIVADLLLEIAREDIDGTSDQLEERPAA